MQVNTETFDNQDGTATAGVASIRRFDGTWREIGRTNFYREYPRMVRARTAADNLCKAFHKQTCAAKGLMACQVSFDLSRV